MDHKISATTLIFSGGMGVFMCGFVLTIELVGEETKTFIGNAYQIPFAIGEAIVCLIAMGIRDWKLFQIVSSIPMFLMLIIWFIIPESPRWLIVNKKYENAVKVINKAAKFNKVRFHTKSSTQYV